MNTTATPAQSPNTAKRSSRIRTAMTSLALASAAAIPAVAVTTASPAQAAANCPEWYCGSGGNHNETTALDDER